MAKVIKGVAAPHDCREEIDMELRNHDLWLGSIVECSCGNRFERRDDQRDGPYWAPLGASEARP